MNMLKQVFMLGWEGVDEVVLIMFSPGIHVVFLPYGGARGFYGSGGTTLGLNPQKGCAALVPLNLLLSQKYCSRASSCLGG